MKTIFACLFVVLFAGTVAAQVAPAAEGPKVKWMTWDEAVQQMEKEPRKIMVDVYTDWCGWCKRMDANTMTNPTVIQILNEQYYAVKMDGEYKNDINFKGRTYKYVANGRRGYHELPAELMNGQMSYPTLVFLDENYGIIQAVPGYQEPAQLEPILSYFGGNYYQNTPWDKFTQTYKSPNAQ